MKEMKFRLLILFVLTTSLNLHAQENSEAIKLLVSSRVDTTSEDINSIIKLYEDYYKSNPDSIYDNPHWNSKEKELYGDFDFSRVNIFQGGINAERLFKYFSPFVMSVEPIGNKYQIRVLFSSPTTDPKYAGSKVWCIQKLNAIKENQTWVFENLLVDISKNWSSKQVGFIKYIYPPTHSFNQKEAERSKAFCQEMIQRFNPSFQDSFDYYVTSSKDEMGLLENFDYYFVGITSGKARETMILTSKGNEYYPHEFVHKLLPLNTNRSYIIEEGLATFLGTKEDTVEYEKLMKNLALDLASNSEKINFQSTISQTTRFNGYQTAYPAGAAICELVHDASGDKGLIQLMTANTIGFDNIVQTVIKITGLNQEAIEIEWKKIINTTASKTYKQ